MRRKISDRPFYPPYRWLAAPVMLSVGRAKARTNWKGAMARTIAIWVFGLLGWGITGSLVGGALTYNGEAAGFFAGAFLFACLRLWLAAPSNRSS